MTVSQLSSCDRGFTLSPISAPPHNDSTHVHYTPYSIGILHTFYPKRAPSHLTLHNFKTRQSIDNITTVGLDRANPLGNSVAIPDSGGKAKRSKRSAAERVVS